MVEDIVREEGLRYGILVAVEIIDGYHVPREGNFTVFVTAQFFALIKSAFEGRAATIATRRKGQMFFRNIRSMRARGWNGLVFEHEFEYRG